VVKSGKRRHSGDGTPLFLGTHEHTLDSKGRVSIPARFRAALGEPRLIVTTNVDSGGRCLIAYPVPAFQRFLDNVSALPQFDESVILLRRLHVAGAAECPIDALGRILIPPTLREHASLRRDVLWAGMGRVIEIWDRRRWAALSGDGSLARRLAKLGL